MTDDTEARLIASALDRLVHPTKPVIRLVRKLSASGYSEIATLDTSVGDTYEVVDEPA